MIKCITFDLDNTLWPCEEVILNAEQKAYEWFDMNCPNISKNLSKEEIREFLVSEAKKKPEYSHNLTFLRLNGYRNLLKNYNYSEKLSEELMELYLNYRNKVNFYDNVLETLTELKNLFILGTISNGNSSLAKIGIRDFFSFEIKSEDVGVKKPDSIIFEHAIKASGVKPENIIHVGDNYVNDICGAKGVDMNYLWINHEQIKEHNIESKYIVNSFQEVKNCILSNYKMEDI